MTKPLIGFSIITHAAKTKDVLSKPALDQVLAFVQSHQLPTGGFCGRTDKPDIYYTFFGLGCAAALGCKPTEPTRSNVFAMDADELDIVHMVCLVRSQCLLQRYGVVTGLTSGRFARLAQVLANRMHGALPRVSVPARDAFLKVYGNNHYIQNCDDLYFAFLIYQALEDIGAKGFDDQTIQSVLDACKTDSGGYGSKPGMADGVATATAAALVLQRRLGLQVDMQAAAWLRSLQAQEGGFLGVPGAPLPDLLTTAAVLFGFIYAGIPLGDKDKELHEDFVAAHWNEDGGFCGSMADLTSDVEYTFYGLLALGLLA